MGVITGLGLEYFCFAGDDLWSRSDDELIELGKRELAALGLVRADRVRDGTLVRMEKACPVYDPDYQDNVDIIRRAPCRARLPPVEARSAGKTHGIDPAG